MSAIKIAIHGAAGRMGQRLLALAHGDPDLEIAAALESPQHPRLGQDAGQIAGIGELGVPLSAALERPIDVVIDFSSPAGAMAITQTCRERGLRLVLATTGLEPEQVARVRQAGETNTQLWAPSKNQAVKQAKKHYALDAPPIKEHPTSAHQQIN
jgi:4-hydroxy-tetrahydrodipicolinate reductase